jgi:hypothetical protein
LLWHASCFERYRQRTHRAGRPASPGRGGIPLPLGGQGPLARLPHRLCSPSPNRLKTFSGLSPRLGNGVEVGGRNLRHSEGSLVTASDLADRHALDWVNGLQSGGVSFCRFGRPPKRNGPAAPQSLTLPDWGVLITLARLKSRPVRGMVERVTAHDVAECMGIFQSIALSSRTCQVCGAGTEPAKGCSTRPSSMSFM